MKSKNENNSRISFSKKNYIFFDSKCVRALRRAFFIALTATASYLSTSALLNVMMDHDPHPTPVEVRRVETMKRIDSIHESLRTTAVLLDRVDRVVRHADGDRSDTLAGRVEVGYYIGAPVEPEPYGVGGPESTE